jgi:hypothetical protein
MGSPRHRADRSAILLHPRWAVCSQSAVIAICLPSASKTCDIRGRQTQFRGIHPHPASQASHQAMDCLTAGSRGPWTQVRPRRQPRLPTRYDSWSTQVSSRGDGAPVSKTQHPRSGALHAGLACPDCLQCGDIATTRHSCGRITTQLIRLRTIWHICDPPLFLGVYLCGPRLSRSPAFC